MLRSSMLAAALCLALAAQVPAATPAPQPDAGPMQVWLWSYGVPSAKDREFYKQMGFTAAGNMTHPQVSPDQVARFVTPTMDEFKAEGLSAGICPVLGLPRTEFSAHPLKGDDIDYKGAAREGDKYYNPFSPIVAAAQDSANEAMMKAVQGYPNLKFAYAGMEYVDDLTQANENIEGVERMKKMLGFTKDQVGPVKFIAPGIIADNDRAYEYLKYVWTGGNGVSTALQRAGDMVHRFRPDVKVISDPYRSVAFYNVYPKAVDIVETWTYTYPDPKAMLYIETLRTACAPLGQTPLQVVSLLTYPGTILPKKVGWCLAEPDVTKESTWITLSRAPKIIGFYYAGECDPIKYSSPADQLRVPRATSLAIRDISHQVVQPFGALIKKMTLTPRKVAVLSSEAARLAHKSRSLLGYPDQQIYQLYSVMAMAHINADVLFDESILNGDLDHYDVLVLPKCDALLKTEYDKIRAFQRRGGLVIADQYLGPNIPGAMRFNFDFTYRQKVNAEAIETGKMIADMGSNDHLDPHKAELTEAAGVTAEADQKIMESYAAELKKRLGDKIVPEADCDNPTVLLNMTQHQGVKYLFVINDKRTYDARTGPYKAIRGKLVPQDVTIRLNQWGGRPLYAYDLLQHQSLKVDHKGNTPVFDVHLGDIGGTIIALSADQSQR